MTTWGQLRDDIRVAVLNDTEDALYTDAQLLVCARWATTQISMHTAEKSIKTYACDGVTNNYALPSGIQDPIERCGLVIWKYGTNNMVLDSSRISMLETYGDSDTNYAYYEWPSGNLQLRFMPGASDQIVMHYFKQWDAPENDSDVLRFPKYLEGAFCMYLAAAAIYPAGVRAANIRQWSAKPDTGTPEHNPLHKQTDFFLRQAEYYLSRVPTQDREHMLRQ